MLEKWQCFNYHFWTQQVYNYYCKFEKDFPKKLFEILKKRNLMVCSLARSMVLKPRTDLLKVKLGHCGSFIPKARISARCGTTAEHRLWTDQVPSSLLRGRSW